MSDLPADINKEGILEKRSLDNFNQQKFKEAIDDLQELIKLVPSQRSGYENNIAMCYKEMNDLKNAELYFKKSKESDPKSQNPYSGLIETYLALNDKPKAIEACKDLLKNFPGNEFAKSKLDSLSK